MTKNSPVTEKPLIEEHQRVDEPAEVSLSDHARSNVGDRASLAVSLRMILFLSILSWGLIALAVAWVLD